jgi:hypothetical protein
MSFTFPASPLDVSAQETLNPADFFPQLAPYNAPSNAPSTPITF